jgi:hypothetical protein
MCSSNTGQIYVRGATYGNYYAVMYSWYITHSTIQNI